MTKEINRLAEGLARAKLSRRQFMARALAAGVSFGAASALLSACGGGQQSATGEITFIGPETPETFKKAIKGFESTKPDIDIKYNNIPFDELNSALQSRLQQEDSTFACYTVDQSRVASYAARGFLADLTDNVNDVESQVLKPSYEMSVYDGKLYALPVWTSSQVLYYNVKALQKAGVELPSLDPQKRWTWEQTVDAAKRAQEAGTKWGFVFEQVNLYYQLQPLPESLGGGPGLTGPNLLEVDITNDAWIEAFEWYRSLFADGVSPRGVPPAENAPLFTAGDVALYVGLPGGPVIEAAAEETGFDFGVGAHPYFDGGEPVTPTDSWSWGINPFSDKQEAALEWLKYVALNPKGALESVVQVPVPPTQKKAFDEYLNDLAADPTWPDGIDELFRYEQLNTARHRPPSVGYVIFEETMAKAFADISNGADVRETFRKTSDQLNRELEPLRRQLEG
jgi:multiple sugar transport system substrate-binding protein